MSYVLQVWEGAEPRDLEEADKILGRLLEDPTRRHRPRLAALAKALWNQFPKDIETAPDDPIWSDGSLSGPQDGEPLLTLGIMSAHLDTMVPFVAAAATANGLVVYDPQYGTVYLPGGRALGEVPPPPAKRAEEDDEFHSKAEVISCLAAALAPFMRREGFEWVEREGRKIFVAPFDGGERCAAIYASGGDVDLMITQSLDRISEEAGRLIPAMNGRPFDAVLMSLSRFRAPLPQGTPGHFHGFVLSGRSAAPSVAAAMVNLFERQVLPGLRELETVPALWQRALDQFGKPAGGAQVEPFRRTPIICGRLLGDARYRQFVEAEHARLAARWVTAERAGSTRAIEREQQEFEEFLARLESSRAP